MNSLEAQRCLCVRCDDSLVSDQWLDILTALGTADTCCLQDVLWSSSVVTWGRVSLLLRSQSVLSFSPLAWSRSCLRWLLYLGPGLRLYLHPTTRKQSTQEIKMKEPQCKRDQHIQSMRTSVPFRRETAYNTVQTTQAACTKKNNKKKTHFSDTTVVFSTTTRGREKRWSPK